LNYHFVKSVSTPEITQKIPFYIIWNWIRIDFQLAYWFFSFCYWISHIHHTDLCTQWTPCTWIRDARNYMLWKRQHSLLYH